MSDATTLDDRTMSNTTANIDLAGRLLHEIVADPDALDRIPDGATLVVLPYDDEALALHNLAMAGALVNQGRTVYFRRVGGSADAGDSATWNGADERWPRWSESPGGHGLSLIHDSEAATLTVDFFTGPRATTRLAIGERTALVVDRDTFEVVGYVLPMELVEELVGRLGRGARSGGRPAETGHRPPDTSAGDNAEAATGYEASTTDAYVMFAGDLARVAA